MDKQLAEKYARFFGHVYSALRKWLAYSRR